MSVEPEGGRGANWRSPHLPANEFCRRWAPERFVAVARNGLAELPGSGADPASSRSEPANVDGFVRGRTPLASLGDSVGRQTECWFFRGPFDPKTPGNRQLLRLF